MTQRDEIRMWVELCKRGIPIGESTPRLLVRKLRKPIKAAYVPLDFAPGERAGFGFGEATVKLGEQLVKVPFLAGRLRYSGAMFMECFPTQRQEALLLGQRHACEFWEACHAGRLRQPQSSRVASAQRA